MMKTFQLTLLAATLGLAACGDKESPATSVESVIQTQDAAEQAAAPGPATSDVTDTVAPASLTGSEVLAQGKAVFSQYCVACHGAGVAGAPKLTDTASWNTRIAQGIDTLNTHALKGFQGSAGYMPPKGGFANLRDDEVIAAVAYMVSEGQ